MSQAIIVIITIAIYFLLLMAVSYFSSRGSNNNTFFTGNRRAPWYLVAIAMVGAPISGVTFISVPGMVAAKGFSYLQMCLGFIVGYIIIAYVLVPMFYKRNLISIYCYLEERFGASTYRTGAWFFFISKMLGAAVRFLVVCAVLQLLVFAPLGIPFVFNVVATIALIWLYTLQGGVKTVIWTDTLKSFCLIVSIVLCIIFIADSLGYSFCEMTATIAAHDSSRIFYFGNPKDGTYFWKQFLAGVFMVIATTGLDQDMMQRNLACRDAGQSRKNMIVSSIIQLFVIALFLVLGTMLVMFLDSKGIAQPDKSDEIFGMVAQHPDMPLVVLILFVLGLISAAYSAAGSALTSLTTSFTIDILGANKKQNEVQLSHTRKLVHLAMSALMGLVIIVFYYMSNQDAISAVYTLASYTYGPILGLFVYGMFCHRPVRDCLVPLVCILAPCLSWFSQYSLYRVFSYETSFELLILNALFTIFGLYLLSMGLKTKKA